jgi:hypothetical protein
VCPYHWPVGAIDWYPAAVAAAAAVSPMRAGSTIEL